MNKREQHKARTKQGLSLSALAKELKRAKSGLHKLMTKGKIPQLPDGSFDRAEVEAALAANLCLKHRKRVPAVHSAVHKANDWDTGEYRCTDPACWLFWEISWSEWPAEAGPKLAAELGVDPDKLIGALHAAVQHELRWLVPTRKSPEGE